MPISPRPNPRQQLDAAEPEEKLAEPELATEDFYYDGPYLVFTAAYHLKRGHCCHSGCRHCPYSDLP